MIQIEDKVVSFDILEEYFSCDYAVCRGACCVHGDAGPPASAEECQRISRSLKVLSPFLSPEAQQVLRKQGISYTDATGERVLSIVGSEQCVFTLHPAPPEGVRCAIEWYAEQQMKRGIPPSEVLKKPISCRLYPIRVREFRHFSALCYDRWDICRAAVARGRQLGVKVYQFLREPLTELYGADFYDQLAEADRLLREERSGRR